MPGSLARQDRVIHDWFPHGTIRLTLAGILAKSSNIGTVLAADRFKPGELRSYLDAFGLGRRTDVGLEAESPGILPDPSLWTEQAEDRIAFGQSLSVTPVQMAAAVNTIANGGVRVAPSLVKGTAVRDDGVEVGTDVADTRRVVSSHAARQTTLMMERVVDPEDGVAPSAQVPGLPGRRQDRDRPAGRSRVRLLRRHLHGLVRRVRPGRRPAVHDLRRHPRPAQRRRRRLGRRPGVLPADGLHAAPVRRRTVGQDGHGPARDVVTRRFRPLPCRGDRPGGRPRHLRAAAAPAAHAAEPDRRVARRPRRDDARGRRPHDPGDRSDPELQAGLAR